MPTDIFISGGWRAASYKLESIGPVWPIWSSSVADYKSNAHFLPLVPLLANAYAPPKAAAWTSMSADVAMPFGAEVELRRARRYTLSAAVTFCWDPGEGILQEGHGTTLDISSSGVFVITDLVPRAGGRLELEIYLSPAGGQSKFVRFHGEGKVVRTIKTGTKSGFAAEVLFQPEGSESSSSGNATTRFYRKS